MVAATGPALRIVYFGTPQFAVPSLRALLDSRHRVAAVVAQPDRPRGRGQRTSHGPVKALALERGLPVLQPTRLRDPAFLDALRAHDPELGVVAAYGRILPDEVLSLPRLGLINVHASVLPKYRGAAPVHRAVLLGERETGVTIMRVVKELDAGPILSTARCAIGPNETSEELERKLATLGADLLIRAVDALAEGRASETAQDAADATYAPRIEKHEGLMDWSKDAQTLHNQVRGLYPWPHAFSFLEGVRYLVLRSTPEPAPCERREPGTVLEARGDRLVVAAGDGTALGILTIQPEGRRAMEVREFLAGHSLAPGQRFTGGA